MKTVVAETVLLGREAFETLGEVVVVPDRQIGPQHLKDADALVIRSKTKVTPELLAGSAVRFIGTATAGFEHIDVQTLGKNGIGWCAAPGCNADSVADYITAALLSLHTCASVNLEGKTIGIIGVGQVGSRVAKRAEALGLRVLLNDPPRETREFDASLLLGKPKNTFDVISGPTLGKNSEPQRSCFQTLEKKPLALAVAPLGGLDRRDTWVVVSVIGPRAVLLRWRLAFFPPAGVKAIRSYGAWPVWEYDDPSLPAWMRVRFSIAEGLLICSLSDDSHDIYYLLDTLDGRRPSAEPKEMR